MSGSAGALLDLRLPTWHADAACVEHPELSWFPETGETDVAAAAKAVCARCLCREECLDYAMADASLVGVWGETTTSQRAEMRSGRGRRRAG